MHRTKPISPVLLIVLWSALVHVPGLLSPLRDYHAYRQCQTASMARNYARHGMHFLSPEVDTEGPPVRAGTEFPIYSYLLALLFKIFGEREVLGRLLSGVFAASGAVYLYHFTRHRLGETIGFWSAMAISTLPVHIYFTRTVQPEPMALWGLLGFLYYLDLWNSGRRKKRIYLLIILLGAIGPLLKLPFMYLVAPLWFLLGYEKGGWALIRRPGYLFIMAAILAGTFSWYHFAKTAPVVLLPLTPQEHLDNLAPLLSLNLWRAQFISRFPEIVLTYVGTLLALLGIFNMRKAKSFRLLASWSLFSIVYVLLLGKYGMIHRYTLLPVTPIAAVWIGCGISMLLGHVHQKPFRAFWLGFLLLGMPVHAALRIKHWYRIEYDYLAQAKSTLDKDGNSTGLVLVVTHEKPEHLYYLDRYGYALQPADWKREDLETMQKNGVQYILVPKEDNKLRLTEWPAATKGLATLLEENDSYLLYRSSARQG